MTSISIDHGVCRLLLSVYLHSFVTLVSSGDLDYIDPKFFEDSKKYPGIGATVKGIQDHVVQDYLDHVDAARAAA